MLCSTAFNTENGLAMYIFSIIPPALSIETDDYSE